MANTPSDEPAVTTIAELAANDIPLIEPAVLSLPSTGTASYNLANINATNASSVGLASGTASLSANFTAMSVDASVNLTMNDTSTWNGSATGMALQSNGGFSGSMGSVSGQDSGATPFTSTSGSFSGSLTGLGNGTVPTGADLNFNMSSGFPADSVSGQASFVQSHDMAFPPL